LHIDIMVRKTRGDGSLPGQEFRLDPVAASLERFLDDLRDEAVAVQFGTVERRIFNRCDLKSPLGSMRN
jgi:hypothetical protein